MLAMLAVFTTFTPVALAAQMNGNVVGVERGDVLNVRAWPDPQSRVIATFMGGDFVRLPGRCKNILTNVSFRLSTLESAEEMYGKMRAANVWCQILDQHGYPGWARGKYILPR
jgi:hypothetical protein